MLTEIYVTALPVDKEVVDQVWDAREIDDLTACVARWPVAAEYL